MYAENDAKEIQKILEHQKGKIYNEVKVDSLIGKEFLRKNLYSTIEAIADEANVEDTILVYISTHGEVVNGKFRLLPYNNKKGANLINFDELFQKVQSIKALNQIFMVDACQSGKANDMVSAIYDAKASVLAKSAGVHLLLATTKGTSAFESENPNIKNGLFTDRVLSALKSQETDKNGDGVISIIELSNRLKEPQEGSEYQHPIIRNVGGDVGLVGL